MSGRPSKLTLLRPGWLLLHVVTLAVCGGMIWLGLWQWRAAVQRHDDLRNYAYALQWWAFVGFTVLMWFRIVHDHLRGKRPAGAPLDSLAADAPAADPRTGTPDAAAAVSPDAGTPAAAAPAAAAVSPDAGTPAGAAFATAPQPPSSRYRGYTPPPPTPELETDPERRRLNAYLARLSAADREAAE